MQYGEYIDPIGKSGGVASWWNESIIIKLMTKKRNMVDTVIKDESLGKEYKITWIYTNCRFDKRHEELRQIGATHTHAWMIVGDFVEIRLYGEKEERRR